MENIKIICYFITLATYFLSVWIIKRQYNIKRLQEKNKIEIHNLRFLKQIRDSREFLKDPWHKESVIYIHPDVRATDFLAGVLSLSDYTIAYKKDYSILIIRKDQQ